MNWEHGQHKGRYMHAFLDFAEMTRPFQADSCSKERRDCDSLNKKRGVFQGWTGVKEEKWEHKEKQIKKKTRSTPKEYHQKDKTPTDLK